MKDNEWIAKPTKKKEENASKENAPFRSGSAKKTVVLEVEGFEMAMRGFMAQMQDSMQNFHVKVDNVATQILFVEKKMREMKNEMRQLKMGLLFSEFN